MSALTVLIKGLCGGGGVAGGGGESSPHFTNTSSTAASPLCDACVLVYSKANEGELMTTLADFHAQAALSHWSPLLCQRVCPTASTNFRSPMSAPNM